MFRTPKNSIYIAQKRKYSVENCNDVCYNIGEVFTMRRVVLYNSRAWVDENKKKKEERKDVQTEFTYSFDVR